MADDATNQQQPPTAEQEVASFITGQNPAGSPPPAEGATEGDATPANDADNEEAGDGDFLSAFTDDGGDAGDDDAGDDDADLGEFEDGEGEGADEDQPPKKKKQSARERINELTKSRRTAERALEQERERNNALEARLSALEKGETPAGGEDGGEDAETPPAQLTRRDGTPLGDPPDPSDMEAYRYGEVDPKYLSDVTQYNVEKALAEERVSAEQDRQATAAKEASEELSRKWDELGTAGASQYDDFNATVFGTFGENPDLMPAVFRTEIPSSEVGADMVYHLARNPQTAERLAAMTPVQQAKEFGKLEQALLARNSRKKGKTVNPTVPPPMGKRTRGSGGQFAKVTASKDFAEVEAHFNELNRSQQR